MKTMSTIWGMSHTQQQIAEGIICVTTGSHGGYILSPERMNEMRPELRALSFTGDNNFEEDCSWCAVALQWPEYFPADWLPMAETTKTMIESFRKERA
jgi:hypothetical protein